MCFVRHQLHAHGCASTADEAHERADGTTLPAVVVDGPTVEAINRTIVVVFRLPTAVLPSVGMFRGLISLGEGKYNTRNRRGSCPNILAVFLFFPWLDGAYRRAGVVFRRSFSLLGVGRTNNQH